jgi:hypothetical protein
LLIEDFLARLNAAADLPTGRRITARMLEDWVYERLVPGPTQIHGKWHWSEGSFAAALRVVEYRQRRFKRAASIRFQKWLEGDLPTETMDIFDIKNEISRVQRLLIRHVTSTHGFRADVDLTDYRRHALLRTLGTLDATLERAAMGVGKTVVLLFYELGRFGEQITPFDEEAEPLAAWITTWCWPDGTHVFAGILEPDIDQEFSVLHAIDALTPHQLERCRTWTQFVSGCLFLSQAALLRLGAPDKEEMLITEAYEKVAENLLFWPWSIFFFATAVNIMYYSEVKEVSFRSAS